MLEWGTSQRRAKIELLRYIVILLVILDFDEDDPLAGLGLSDDDDDVLTNAKKLKSKKPELTRKLSHTSSKGKVDPNLGNSGSSLPDTSPARCKFRPFLCSLICLE